MYKRLSRRTTMLLVTALAAGALGVGAAEQPSQGLPLKLVANAFNLGSVGTARRSATVYIYVERWSTDEERLTLRKAFQEGGQDKLLEALQDTKPVGTIRTPEKLAYDLRYAVQVPTDDGGRRILIATDRPIGAIEAARNGRTTTRTARARASSRSARRSRSARTARASSWRTTRRSRCSSRTSSRSAERESRGSGPQAATSPVVSPAAAPSCAAAPPTPPAPGCAGAACRGCCARGT
jgi:hypothetical protein